MKKIALVAAALMLMPAAGRAQEHMEHAQPKAAKPHTMEMKQHEQFVQSLIDQRAELQLSEAQIVKLNAFKTKLLEHHKMMMAQDGKMMKHDDKMMKEDSAKMADMHHPADKMAGMKMHSDSSMAMHKELLSIFTPDQRKKVEALMQEHMKSCSMSDGMQCKVQK